MPPPGLRALALWGLGRLLRFRVSGASMVPTLSDGDYVLVDPSRRAEAGAVVLARHPYRSGLRLVKRVARIEGDGRLFLSGDQPVESTDSRHFGALAPGCVLGVVVARMRG